MSLKFCKFKFTQKTTPKKFFRYRITDNNPYSDKQDFKGNAVRHKLINRKENKKNTPNGQKIRMFMYVLDNEYLITHEKIKDTSNLGKNLSLELISENEEFPIIEENLDLYRQWTKYHVYLKVIFYCDIKKYAYDYTIENEYSKLINTPKNKLNMVIRRIFEIDTEVLTDGTVYLAVNVKHEYENRDNIYDLIRRNENVTGMNVKCSWASFGGTYPIKEVLDIPIKDNIKSLNLMEYWSNQCPWKLNNIDTNAPIVAVYNKSKNGDSYHIPQSLVQVIRREDIAMKDKLFSRKIDRYTKLSMGKRLEIIQSFLQTLNYKDNIIDLTPIPVEELGYSYYDINRDMPNLLIANNRRIGFNEKYKAFQYGFYRLPEKPVFAAFMSYENMKKESQDVVQAIQDYTRGLVNKKRNNQISDKLLPLRFYPQAFHYKKGDNLSYQEKANEIKKAEGVNFVISVLPIDVDEEEFYNYSINSPYDSFKRVFADLNIPSQMMSLNMIEKLGTQNITYTLQNLVLGILCKSGGMPWILEKPLDDVDCFVGLDVGKQETGIHYPACSVCLDGRGNLIGYYSTNVAQSGEKIATDSLEKIFNNVLISYKEANGDFPKHIVIHRDGFSNEENDWYIEYFGRRNIEFDIVEIRKNIDIRLLEEEQISNEMNPSTGSAVIKDNTAYIITTNVNANLGAPTPLLLVHSYGNLSVESIAKQIYILSEMHIGSMRTSRLPLTTFYADKICKHHNHVPHDILTNKLYFL